jgi:nitrogenase molybdenum-iron protein alpha/beta subunit
MTRPLPRSSVFRGSLNESPSRLALCLKRIQEHAPVSKAKRVGLPFIFVFSQMRASFFGFSGAAESCGDSAKKNTKRASKEIGLSLIELMNVFF